MQGKGPLRVGEEQSTMPDRIKATKFQNEGKSKDAHIAKPKKVNDGKLGLSCQEEWSASLPWHLKLDLELRHFYSWTSYCLSRRP